MQCKLGKYVYNIKVTIVTHKLDNNNPSIQILLVHTKTYTIDMYIKMFFKE